MDGFFGFSPFYMRRFASILSIFGAAATVGDFCVSTGTFWAGGCPILGGSSFGGSTSLGTTSLLSTEWVSSISS